MIIIRKAKIEDMIEVGLIYENAKKGLKESGIDQWQTGYPNHDTFKLDMEHGTGHTVLDDELVIGTASIAIENEPTYDEIYDGAWLTDNSTYGLVHRIAVLKTEKNKGVASKIFAYLDEMCKEKGITSSRCDTHMDNKIMQHTLEKNGYVKCGIIHLVDGDLRFGYEKKY